jgi:hypothetical protein
MTCPSTMHRNTKLPDTAPRCCAREAIEAGYAAVLAMPNRRALLQSANSNGLAFAKPCH